MQHIAEGSTVIVIEIDRLASVTAGGDVVDRAGELDAQGAGYAAIVGWRGLNARPDPNACRLRLQVLIV
jgi:hypothetical protein